MHILSLSSLEFQRIFRLLKFNRGPPDFIILIVEITLLKSFKADKFMENARRSRSVPDRRKTVTDCPPGRTSIADRGRVFANRGISNVSSLLLNK